MEVDSKTKDSKLYSEKTKTVKRSGLAMGICTFLMVVFLTLGVLSACSVLKVSLIWQIMWWFGLLGSAGLWLVFYSRRLLGLRVGDPLDEKELHSLEITLEKYNM